MVTCAPTHLHDSHHSDDENIANTHVQFKDNAVSVAFSFIVADGETVLFFSKALNAFILKKRWLIPPEVQLGLYAVYCNVGRPSCQLVTYLCTAL